MKGFVKAIKEYLAFGLYIIIYSVIMLIYAYFSIPYKDNNIELYRKIIVILTIICSIYILLTDVFYPSLISKILNYKYVCENKYQLRIFIYNIIRFGILGTTLYLFMRIDSYPSYLNYLNIVYITNIAFCFVPKFNCTLGHKLLKINMVTRREKKQPLL